MKKTKAYLSIALVLCLLVIIPTAFAVHGGEVGGLYYGTTDYLVKSAKWTAVFDNQVFDLEITDWSWASSEMFKVFKTSTTYEFQTSTVMKAADVESPWFYFTAKEYAEPGNYQVAVIVTGPDGSQIDSWTKFVYIEPHDYSTIVEKINATCLTQGSIEYACTCGLTRIETIPPLGHDWDEWLSISKATCEDDGLDKRTCKRDSLHFETRSHSSAFGHDWGEWKVSKTATCLEEGEEKRVCRNDAAHIENRNISAFGHDWGEWEISKEPTNQSEGEEKRVCKHDITHVETRPLDKLLEGWVADEKVWYLYKDSVALTGWQQVGDAWYYMDNKGAMQTAWLAQGDVWYYLLPNGAMATGWEQVGGTWYYFNQSGAMRTGWLNLGNAWYYLRSSGAMATGWQDVGGTWYYLYQAGQMATGWMQSGNTWYYLAPNGAMVTGMQNIDGETHQFSSDGTWLGN